MCFPVIHPRHSQVLVLFFAISKDHLINQQLIFCASTLTLTYSLILLLLLVVVVVVVVVLLLLLLLSLLLFIVTGFVPRL